MEHGVMPDATSLALMGVMGVSVVLSVCVGILGTLGYVGLRRAQKSLRESRNVKEECIDMMSKLQSSHNTLVTTTHEHAKKIEALQMHQANYKTQAQGMGIRRG